MIMTTRRFLHLAWKNTPYAAMHLACPTALLLPFSWGLVWLAGGLYLVRMFGVTAGYHRYFSHRTYRTSRAFQLVLALLGLLALQKGPLWWAAHHRRHHRFYDTEDDVHSPVRRGFFWAHMGWIMVEDFSEADLGTVKDLTRYPELVFLDRQWYLPSVVLGAVLLALGGLPALVWGLPISVVACWHATYTINSLNHMIGGQRYATGDGSRNSAILAVLTLGEGWHNNHHYHKTSTRQGFFWWEYDITYYLLKLLAAVGLVWGLKEPPARVKYAHLEHHAPPRHKPAAPVTPLAGHRV